MRFLSLPALSTLSALVLVLSAAPAHAEAVEIDTLIEQAEGAEAPDGEFVSSEEGEGDEGSAVSAPVEAELPQPQAGTLAPCTPEQARLLGDLGREYALRLVRNDFLGGREIEHLVEDCTYDGQIYQGILHVRWRGMVMGWNQYNVWGRLRTLPDGSDATFAPRGASEGVQSLQFWGTLGTIGLSLVR